MKYALLIVEVEQDDTPSGTAASGNFVRSVEQRLGTKANESMLNAWCWLVKLEEGLNVLNQVSTEAKDRKYQTRTLFFEQEPSWVVSAP